MKIKFEITPLGEQPRFVQIKGRDAWALDELVKAGSRGCTPIDNPAPRWSAYVHDLRHEYGINIETITESHGGQFAGTHARYVLRDDVEIVEVQNENA